MNHHSPPRVALVTGASGGIGEAIAQRLATDGFAVIVNYAGNAGKAHANVEKIEAAGGRAVAIRADVGEASEVRELFEGAKEAFGRLDVVVNCAGVMPMAPIKPVSLSDFDKVVATNLRGTFLILAYASEYLGEGGRIIAISTSVIAKSFPSYGPYIASKAGVEGLVHVLANELRGRRITVNAVAPGPVETELFLKDKSQAQIDGIAKLSPLERLGTPMDISGVVSFLAGPDGAWVNSQVIRANGGFA